MKKVTCYTWRDLNILSKFPQLFPAHRAKEWRCLEDFEENDEFIREFILYYIRTSEHQTEYTIRKNYVFAPPVLLTPTSYFILCGLGVQWPNGWIFPISIVNITGSF